MVQNFKLENIRIIVGLGNPGKRYESTYHNAGILFVEYLKSNLSSSGLKLATSESYMNKSGPFIKRITAKEGARPSELLVAHDDSDIKLGEYKLSFGRNSAGHRGVKSVIENLGTRDFWRLRIGIRRERSGLLSLIRPRREKAIDLVLKQMTKGDRKVFEETFNRAVKDLGLGTG